MFSIFDKSADINKGVRVSLCYWIILAFICNFVCVLSFPSHHHGRMDHSSEDDYDERSEVECNSSELYDILTEKCYPLNERGPCAENLIFVTSTNKHGRVRDRHFGPGLGAGIGACECQQSIGCQYWPFSYNSKENRCFPLYEQGPCAENEWLIEQKDDNKHAHKSHRDHGHGRREKRSRKRNRNKGHSKKHSDIRGVCQPNSCSNVSSSSKPGARVFSRNGICYEVGTQGFCTEGEKIYFKPGNPDPTCSAAVIKPENCTGENELESVTSPSSSTISTAAAAEITTTSTTPKAVSITEPTITLMIPSTTTSTSPPGPPSTTESTAPLTTPATTTTSSTQSTTASAAPVTASTTQSTTASAAPVTASTTQSTTASAAPVTASTTQSTTSSPAPITTSSMPGMTTVSSTTTTTSSSITSAPVVTASNTFSPSLSTTTSTTPSSLPFSSTAAITTTTTTTSAAPVTTSTTSSTTSSPQLSSTESATTVSITDTSTASSASHQLP